MNDFLDPCGALGDVQERLRGFTLGAIVCSLVFGLMPVILIIPGHQRFEQLLNICPVIALLFLFELIGRQSDLLRSLGLGDAAIAAFEKNIWALVLTVVFLPIIAVFACYVFVLLPLHAPGWIVQATLCTAPIAMFLGAFGAYAATIRRASRAVAQRGGTV